MVARKVGLATLLHSTVFGLPLQTEKYRVVIPRPQSHYEGSAKFHLGSAALLTIENAARAASPETERIVRAQLLDRLPGVEFLSPGDDVLTVEFLHFLPEWSVDSWQPVRERNETYGLQVDPHRLVIDASSSWALSNAMSTLYQLMQVQRSSAGEWMDVMIENCPHIVQDTPAFPHRGLVLDTARTFYPVSWIKDLLVQFGEFKLNVLHLHLTDTSAWSLDIESHPELSEHLSYRDIDGKKQSYSRKDVQELVEFGRLRGVSLYPEIDGPVHAPALADGKPLELTVAATADFTTEDFGVEPPVGTWNFSSSRVMGVLTNVFAQLEEDFKTAPFLHVGGDEPRASALCAALTDEATIMECWKQCTKKYGGSPGAPGCSPTKNKPANSSEKYWFPEVLNKHVQDYFDALVPTDAKIPTMAWSGVREDMGVELPLQPKKLEGAKQALQLWQFPAKLDGGLTEEDCERYDIIQSSATHPQNKSSPADAGWLYLECGEGQNWIGMKQNYWCNRASWISVYTQNLTQHSAPALSTPRCQKAFIGAELAIWGEITGTGNSMALIFPRAAAFAERAWTNPPALTWDELNDAGAPPAQYYQDNLKGVVRRLNTVVENFNLRGTMVDRLQPKFCFDHPEYCEAYTEVYFPKTEQVLV